MKTTFVAMSLGALVALSPLCAMAQSAPAQAEQVAQADRRRPQAEGVSPQTFAQPRQPEPGESEGWGRAHAPDAHAPAPPKS